MAERLDSYDLYGYIEDDILIHDPTFFDKLRWFCETFGDKQLLQPNRYEIRTGRKVYVDGPMPPKLIRPFLSQHAETLEATCLSSRHTFVQARNPMSGCFFLNNAQLKKWVRSPFFNDRDPWYGNYLESTQILGPLRLFDVYKSALTNPFFLEVVHADPRLSNSRVAAITLNESDVFIDSSRNARN